MPSTYSPSLKLELIGTGEQAGTWGITTNNNLGTLLEQAITGVITLNMGDATYTMTNYNGLSDEARNAVLVLNGPITSPQALIMPPQQKVYIVRNRTGNSVTLSANVGGVNVSIANAASEVIFCDGSNVYSATQFNYVDGDLIVTGTATANNLVATHNVTFGTDVFGNASTGQIYLPTGNTSSRTSSPINGLIRYNETGQFYEGYANGVWIKFVVAPQGNYTISYVVVAGGGSGGDVVGGGGGAGGMLVNTFTAIPSTSYAIVIGAGGTGQMGYGTNGSNSYINSVATSTGGGSGGSQGGAGGSGGSGGGTNSVYGYNAGTGIPGQGNNGAGSTAAPGLFNSAGGGGGAGAAGSSGAYGNGGAGGAGLETTITGTSLFLAGGGGGSGTDSNGGGGTGGGAGGSSGAGNPGTVNTGGGGGGTSSGPGTPGGNGGSGVVYLSIPTASYSGNYTGLPTITTSGSNTILKFTSSGSYTA